MVVFVYCSIAPIVLPVAFLLFTGGYFVYKNQALYLYVQKGESGGAVSLVEDETRSSCRVHFQPESKREENLVALRGSLWCTWLSVSRRLTAPPCKEHHLHNLHPLSPSWMSARARPTRAK